MTNPPPTHTVRIYAAACSLLALALSMSLAYADDWKLPTLMQLLAQNKTGRALFVEKKYLGIIDKPLESSGELSFTAPDKLEKRTLKPRLESMILDGDSLTVSQPGKHPVTVSLQEHPEISAFIESIRATLAGDRRALEKFYALELTGSSDKWELQLTPTQTRMANIISKIKIGGSRADVKSIDFEQDDGDRSEMLITKVAPQ